jgi:hypothetical protein
MEENTSISTNKYSEAVNTPNKFNNENCKNEMTFEECELAILRHAVDETEKIKQTNISQNPDIQKMIHIVEEFIREKKCVCYGGTAINNILPKDVQFYNRDIEIPDYDFFSKNALSDCKELANRYYRAGFVDVEAKSGVHVGTYKVFVNFIPMADITEMHPELFDAISEEVIIMDGIQYAPPNYLRMSMFLELSRPKGDVSRWEKVLKRLTLLNKYYPLKTPFNCSTIDFQRKMETHLEDSDKIYYITRDAFIEEQVVFFGGYATSLYSRYMPPGLRRIVKTIPDFDVLSETPEICAEKVKLRLTEKIPNIKQNIKIIHWEAIGEIIPEHIEIQIGKETIAFIYKPVACHNYNVLTIADGREIRVATIDTMLSFYLAFLYTNESYFYKDRILCMANFLFDVEQKNRLNQDGLLKRFSVNCYGKQPTLESMRAEKTEMFKLLKNKRDNPEYERWFLKYIPNEITSKMRNNIMISPENLSKTAELPNQEESIKHIDTISDITENNQKSRKRRRRTYKKNWWNGIFKETRRKRNYRSKKNTTISFLAKK